MHSLTSRPVAVDVLDEDVVGWGLDGDTFIFVCDFNVMDVDVLGPDIDAVKTSVVTTANDHVVDLSHFCQSCLEIVC